jgi:SAM-dependent methyltransferase
MRLGTFYRARLLRRLGYDRMGGRILDVGGFDGLWAASVDGAERYVIDLAPVAAHARVHYVRGDALRLPFRDNSFEGVFALDVLEHVADEDYLVAEAVRVLRPGGRLILTVPSRSIHVFPKSAQGWVNRRWKHDRVSGFDRADVEGFLDNQRFTQVRIVPIAMRALLSTYLPLAALWRVSGPVGRWATDLAAAWDARHLEGEEGGLLVEATL